MGGLELYPAPHRLPHRLLHRRDNRGRARERERERTHNREAYGNQTPPVYVQDIGNPSTIDTAAMSEEQTNELPSAREMRRRKREERQKENERNFIHGIHVPSDYQRAFIRENLERGATIRSEPSRVRKLFFLLPWWRLWWLRL